MATVVIFKRKRSENTWGGRQEDGEEGGGVGVEWYLRDVFFGVILAWAQVALLGGDPCRDRGGGEGGGGGRGGVNAPGHPNQKGLSRLPHPESLSNIK